MGKRRSSGGSAAAPSVPSVSPGLPSPGDSIEVWWEGDAVYYPGVVHSYDAAKNTFHVNYIDGDVDEGINLSTEKWRFCKPNSLNGTGANAANSAAAVAAPPTSAARILPTPTRTAPAAGVPASAGLPKKPLSQTASEIISVDVEKRSTSHINARNGVNSTAENAAVLKRVRPPSLPVKSNSAGVSSSEPFKRVRRALPAPIALATPPPNPPPIPTKSPTVGTMSALATEAARTVCTMALLPVKADVEALKSKTVESIKKNDKICDTIEAMAVKQEEVADVNKKMAQELAKSEAQKSRDVEKYVKNYLDEYFQAHQKETTKLKNRQAELEKELNTIRSNKTTANGNGTNHSTIMGLMLTEAEKIRDIVQKNNSGGIGDVEAFVKKSIMPGVEKILVQFLENEKKMPPPGDARKSGQALNRIIEIDRRNSVAQNTAAAAAAAAQRPATFTDKNASRSDAVGNTGAPNSASPNTPSIANTKTDDSVMKDVPAVPTAEEVRILVARRATKWLLGDFGRMGPPIEQTARNEWTKSCCENCFRNVAEYLATFKTYQEAKAAILSDKETDGRELKWFTHPGIEQHILNARKNYDESWEPKLENQEWFAEASVLREIGRRFRAAELGEGSTSVLTNRNSLNFICKVTQAAMEVD